MSWFSDVFDFVKDVPLVGDVVSGGLDLLGGFMTNDANAEQASNQQNFQERMSGTSYQRAVADMKAAGLNPMLAYSAGGASTPSGSQASMQNAIGSGVSTAQQQARLSADLKNIQADTAKKVAETDLAKTKSWTETSNQDVNTQLVEQMNIANQLAKGVNPSKIVEAKSSSAAAAARVPSLRNEAAAANTWYGRNVMPYLPSALQGAHSAGAIRDMFPGSGNTYNFNR